MKAKQIPDSHNLPLTTANIATAPANTLGAYLKTVAPIVTQSLTCLVVSTDAAKASNTGLSSKPLALPDVYVNEEYKGQVATTKTGVPFYISSDGTTARALAAMIAGDFLYVNTSVLGFTLDATDVITLKYPATA